MTYRPAMSFYSGTDDISDDVLGILFEHGVNILVRKTGPNRLRTRGTMVFDNIDGYWTDALLEQLGVIEMREGSDILWRGTVREYRFDHDDALVNISLQSATASGADALVEFSTGAVIDAAAVLTAAGVTITAESPLTSAVEADEGAIFMGTLSEFIDAFAVFIDGFTYENHLGEARALEKNDSRASTLDISAAAFDIDADSAVSHLRRGWRRDAQNIETLGVTLVEEDFDVASGSKVSSLAGRRVQNMGQVQRLFFRPISTLTADQQSRFRYYSSFSPIRVRPSGGASGNRPVGVNPEDETELYFDLDTRSVPLSERPGSTVAEHRTWALNADITSNYNLDMWLLPTAFDVHKARLTVGATIQHGLAADMPWAISEESVQVVQQRLENAAVDIPRVTKLVFPLVQENEARFRALVEHRIGSVSQMVFNEPWLMISGIMALLFVRWRWERGRSNTVEMHFLQLREAGTLPLYFETEDQPIFFETEDQPVERQP